MTLQKNKNSLIKLTCTTLFFYQDIQTVEHLFYGCEKQRDFINELETYNNPYFMGWGRRIFVVAEALFVLSCIDTLPNSQKSGFDKICYKISQKIEPIQLSYIDLFG
jgi:hypothetical protein